MKVYLVYCCKWK